MTDAVGTDDLAGFDFPVLDLINLEGFGMAEVLEDIAVFVCYCLNCMSFLKLLYGITEVTIIFVPASVFLFLISLP